MSGKPTIIFITGAWHSEFHAKPALPYFDNLGYNVTVLTLANLGAHEGEDPKPTNQDSVDKILKAMQGEAKAGRGFIILAHSAGGLVAALAVNEFLASASAGEKTKLHRLVFLAAFFTTSRHIITHWHHYDQERQVSSVMGPENVFFNDMAVEDSRAYCDALDVMSIVSRPDEFDDAWHQVPSIFIVTLQDKALLPDKQKIEAEEHGCKVVEIDSGHCPFVSQPEQFATLVDSILMKDKGVKM